MFSRGLVGVARELLEGYRIAAARVGVGGRVGRYVLFWLDVWLGARQIGGLSGCTGSSSGVAGVRSELLSGGWTVEC